MTAATTLARLHLPVRWTRNGVSVPLADVPLLRTSEWRQAVLALCDAGGRLVALFPLAGPSGRRGWDLLAAVAHDRSGQLALARTEVPPIGVYPALTPDLPEAQAFERELAEEMGLRPEGHPWLKPLRHSHRPQVALDGRRQAPPHEFFRVEGEGIHEVAVGPVHAGIIEPGHFRFQCHGEEVLHLELHLGYQHRGAEGLLLAGSPARRQAVAEAIAGDTTIGHGLAHDALLEALAGVEVPLAAQVLRGIALELERLSNHVGDLGAICNDIGYLPGASFYGRLRGEFLNLLVELSGNRVGRGLLRPGGVRFGLARERREAFLARLDLAARDLDDTAAATFDASSVLARLERTGTLSAQAAEELGVVGVAARASGCARDVRKDHPSGVYRFAHIPLARAATGDVLARAQVRLLEIARSITFVREQVPRLPDGPLAEPLPPPRPERLAVALVEGWRGEVVHAAATDAAGALAAYKVVDPSFHNWFGLAVAMRGNAISDFPLVNKSFNLSYAGHDL
ncbi:MAG TPA: hydrogenase [Anaeromyxobacter sp.]|nr:hydrogenase [Anaeromyxobacter sp.]